MSRTEGCSASSDAPVPGSRALESGALDSTTTIQTLKDAVRAFSEARDWAKFHAPRELAVALSVEAGELLELFLWTDDRVPGHRALPAGEALEDELADVTLCLLNLSARTGVDLASAVARKLEKNARKYPEARVKGSALRYHEYAPDVGVEHSAPQDLPPLGVVSREDSE